MRRVAKCGWAGVTTLLLASLLAMAPAAASEVPAQEPPAPELVHRPDLVAAMSTARVTGAPVVVDDLSTAEVWVTVDPDGAQKAMWAPGHEPEHSDAVESEETREDGEPYVPFPRAGELEDRRTMTSESWGLLDGAVETVIHTEPIHFQPADDEGWERIDNRLVPDDEPGWVRNAANGWEVRFGPIGPGGSGGVEITAESGTIRMAPEGVDRAVAPWWAKATKPMWSPTRRRGRGSTSATPCIATR